VKIYILRRVIPFVLVILNGFIYISICLNYSFLMKNMQN